MNRSSMARQMMTFVVDVWLMGFVVKEKTKKECKQGTNQ